MSRDLHVTNSTNLWVTHELVELKTHELKFFTTQTQLIINSTNSWVTQVSWVFFWHTVYISTNIIYIYTMNAKRVKGG
jgi:hypothetical protein